MSRTALFANAFNGIISKARQEADQQKASLQKELEEARKKLEASQAKVAELERQISEIDDELAVGLVAAARNAGIKVDFKSAGIPQPKKAEPQSGKSSSSSPKTDSTKERVAILTLLEKKRGQWVPSTEIKDTTGVERPVSLLLKGADNVESRGKGRGVQYRLK